MGQVCGTYEGQDNAYVILVSWPEGKRPLGRPKRGRENIIKTEIKCDGKVRTKLVWLRTVTSGWLFLTRYINCGFNTRHRIPCVWEYYLLKKTDLVSSVYTEDQKSTILFTSRQEQRQFAKRMMLPPPPPSERGKSVASNTGLSKKMDGIWNRYNLKSTGRIYTFGVLKCSEKFKVLHLP